MGATRRGRVRARARAASLSVWVWVWVWVCGWVAGLVVVAVVLPDVALRVREELRGRGGGSAGPARNHAPNEAVRAAHIIVGLAEVLRAQDLVRGGDLHKLLRRAWACARRMSESHRSSRALRVARHAQRVPPR